MIVYVPVIEVANEVHKIESIQLHTLLPGEEVLSEF